MNVLGVSAYFHDSAAALVIDGAVVAAAQEERFSRRKGDPGLPKQAIRFCLETSGLKPEELDRVVFYEKPFEKFLRIVGSCLGNAPHGYRFFRGSVGAWFEKKLWVQDELAGVAGVKADRIAFCSHHLAHAAGVFLTRPLDSAAVLVVDGVGEWASTTIGRLRRSSRGLGYEELRRVEFPHSLGLFYSAFTAFLGFKVNEGEYKVMGLAALGRPTYVKAIRQLLRRSEDGAFRLDLKYFAHDRSTITGWSRQLEDLLGACRRPGAPRTAGDWERDADIACSLQHVIEDELLNLAGLARKLTGETDLCYSGGVALNSVANKRLALEGPFRRIYVHPASGDAGAALGAALAYWGSQVDLTRCSTPAFTPYLGSPVDLRSVDAWLPSDSGIRREEARSEKVFCDLLSQLLVLNLTVGFISGRAEWGPRALGARSLLARPDLPSQKDRLNRTKNRESFRPLAPVCLDRYADLCFADLSPGLTLEPYMLSTATTRPEWRERLRAATHVDGSARVQVLRPEDHPRLYRLLEHFHSRTGIPALVNTSFNVDGEPLVNSLDDAWRSFQESDVDVLAAFPFIFLKNSARAALEQAAPTVSSLPPATPSPQLEEVRL